MTTNTMKQKRARLVWVALLAVALLAIKSTAQDLNLNTLMSFGRQSFQAFDYAAAERYYARALEKVEDSRNPDSDRAMDLQDIATLFQIMGRFEESERLFQRALVIVRTGKSIDRHIEPVVMSNLATVYRQTGKNEQAESLLKDALRLMERYLDPQHPRIIDAVNNLAVLYGVTSRYDLAEKSFKKLIEQMERRGADARDIAPILTNLATLYVLEKKWQRADPLLRRALSMFETSDPINEPDRARALNNLGIALLNGKHDLAGAERAIRRSLEIWRTVFGPEHASTATVSSNLADVLRELGRYEEARTLYEHVVRVQERAAPLTRVELAGTLDGYAVTLRKLKRDIEAAEIEARARSIQAELTYTVRAKKSGYR